MALLNLMVIPDIYCKITTFKIGIVCLNTLTDIKKLSMDTGSTMYNVVHDKYNCSCAASKIQL